MSGKGMNLYFGFKISEEKMIRYFYNEEFIKYAKKEVDKTIKKNGSNGFTMKKKDSIKSIKNMNSLANITVMFQDYYNGSFFSRELLTDDDECSIEDSLIHIVCPEYCGYENHSNWIIGIKVAHFVSL